MSDPRTIQGLVKDRRQLRNRQVSLDTGPQGFNIHSALDGNDSRRDTNKVVMLIQC